jgi:cyclohexyl-isocyanide hydratase
MRIGMVIFPGFQLLDVAGPLELFRMTEGMEPWLIAKSDEPVPAFKFPGVTVKPDYSMEHAPEFDILFVPGGYGLNEVLADSEQIQFLAHRGERATHVTSVCTGALALGAAGLLQGYRAATHWRFMGLLKDAGAIPVDERVVVDRNRITAGGVTAGIDFGLTLIGELIGKDAAERAQLWLQYAPSPPFNAGHPSSAPAAITKQLEDDSEEVYEQRRQLILTAAK